MKIQNLNIAKSVLLLVYVFLSWTLIAAVPNTINYQGYLTGSSDMPVDATEIITFTIYDAASGGTALWSETENVLVTGGTFSNQLGDTTPFPAGLFNGQALYIGITVGTDLEMSPRKPVTSAPYAFKAAEADSAATATQADNAAALEGKTSTELDQSAHVTDTANPHSVTAAQAGAATTANITSAISVHTSNRFAHHTRYTNAEALSAMGPKADINPRHHNKYTDNAAFSAVLQNDGAGTNLDADLLDGQHASDIIASVNSIESKINITFETEWSNYGSVYAPVTYYKDRDRVYLEGLARYVGSSSSSVAFLPAGYRPAFRLIFNIPNGNSTSARIDVLPTGEIRLMDSPLQSWFDFSGVSFRVD